MNKTNLNFTINIWTLIALAAVAFWLFGRADNISTVNRWKDNFDIAVAHNDDLSQGISKLDSIIISKVRVIEFTQKELNKALKSDSIQRDLAKRYKRTSQAITIETEFVHDTVWLPKIEADSPDTIYDIWSDCFEFDLGLKSGSLFLSNILIENRQDIMVGELKRGLWRNEQVVSVRNSNPCIVTKGMQTYNVIVPVKWHQKWWISIPAGIAVGYGAAKIQ